MQQIERFYPIGTPGQPWGEAERAQWRASQRRQRSHATEVVDAIEHLRTHWDVEVYGQLDYAPDSYPLLALHSSDWDDSRPVALITGGVHGYETSGVMGALKFARDHVDDYAGRLNLLVVPCVSPWGYERIQRWNAGAVDPNRSFRAHSPAMEAAALMHLVAPLAGRFLVHIDLHETTDSDESEFRPALAARDGKPFEPGGIPDGFYLVDDSENRQPRFQQAMASDPAKSLALPPFWSAPAGTSSSVEPPVWSMPMRIFWPSFSPSRKISSRTGAPSGGSMAK